MALRSGRRIVFALASSAAAIACGISAPVRAQVVFDGTQVTPVDTILAVCTDATGEVFSNFKDNCGTGLTGGDAFHLKGIAFGQNGANGTTYLDKNGDAYFEHYLQIEGETLFTSKPDFDAGLTANGITSNDGITNKHGLTNTGGITNSGGITSSGAFTNNASFTNNGNLTVRDKLSTDTFTANSAEIAGYMIVGAHLTGNNGATFSDNTTTYNLYASNALTLGAGATVDMGGNPIQNVGAPVEGTDAATKDYVDGMTSSAQGIANTALANAAAAQGTADTALANAAAAQTTANTAFANAAAAQSTANTAVANAAAAQGTADTARVEAAAAQTTANTGLARTGNLGAGTAAALGGGSAYDAATGALSAPSYGIAGTTYHNVGAAFAAVDNQLSNLDARIDVLSASTGRGFRQGNAGIAAAMALGGTMIVPDSTVSVSFNLATYRGQQGYAGMIAVRAAPKVYISGGITGSTVSGSAGGRVGVAFGF
jgi:hypothetical protein